MTAGLLGGLLTGLLVLLDLVGAGCLTGSISPSYKYTVYAMSGQGKLNKRRRNTSNKMRQESFKRSVHELVIFLLSFDSLSPLVISMKISVISS